MQALLEKYTHQRFPNLADESNAAQARLSLRHPLQLASSSASALDVVRAAAVRLVCAYVDGTEVLVGAVTDAEETRLALAEVHAEEGQSQPSRADVQRSLAEQLAAAEPAAAASLAQLCRDAGYQLAEGESPALITVGDVPPKGEDWYPRHGVSVFVPDSGAELHLIADASQLSEGAAEQFLEQLSRTASAFASEPDASFLDKDGSLSLHWLVSEEDEALRSAYAAPYEAERAHLATEWLARNARERPEDVAHELYDEPDGEKRTLTWAQLERQSNQLARWLIQQGVEKESRVGICRGRDEHFYIAMAATLKAGGCYLPIDADLPPERKSYIAKDSEALLVLTNEAQAELFGKLAHDMDDKELQGKIAQESEEALEPIADLDGLAYILYTSGTSGNPKGCLQLHRGVFWAIEAMVTWPREIVKPETDKRLAMAAVAFDVHISEIVQSWALGVCLVSVASRLALLADLQENIERLGIAQIGMVPSMIEATLTKQPNELPIKYLVSGGEKLTDAVLAKWAAHPDVILANFYGPTEATIGCTSRRLEGVHERRDNIGLAFPGCGAYVADANLNIVPRAHPGELIVEGPLVGRGYLNLPDVTKKAFIAWPTPGSRAYRTGDLVRMNHDGTISISGRIDSQVKLRGVRIESEGVSAVVRDAADEQPLDAVTVVTTHEAAGGSDLLVTFVAPNDDAISANDRRAAPALARLSPGLMETLRDATEQGLASYMRPSHIIPTEFLPLSHNGKIDAKPLIALFKETDMDKLMELQEEDGDGGAKGDQAADEREPTELEAKLIAMIEQLTQARHGSFSPSRKLLETGLSSLNFAVLTTRIRNELGARFSVAQLMSIGRIADCAAAIEGHSEGSSRSNDEAAAAVAAFADEHRSDVEAVFKADDVERILPPLPVQPGVLFQITQDPSRYVQHFLYELQDGITREQLTDAWTQAVARHEILRTGFLQTDRALAQVVLHSNAAELPLFDADADVQDSQGFLKFFEGRAESVAKSINDDISSPCWQLTLCGTERSKPRFMAVSLNHAVYDAFAVRALMTDLDRLLGSSEELPSAVALTDILSSIAETSEAEHKKYWQDALAPAVERQESAPSRRPKAGAKSERSTHGLAASLSDVQSRCSELGITLQSFFYAAFALAGRSAFGWSQDAVFGTVRSGRNLAVDGIENAVCPLVTLVPMHVDLAQGDADSFLSGAHDSLVASLPHEHSSLGQVQGWLGVKSLFDVLFSCRHEQDASGYSSFKHLEGSPPAPEFILAIEMLFVEKSDSIEARAARTSELDSAVSTELLNSLDSVVTALLAGDDGQLKLRGRPENSANSRPKLRRRGKARDEGPEPSAETLKSVTSIVADFLQQPASSVTAGASLVSLGLTSLRAVALSRALQKKGLSVDPVDIIQGDSTRAVAQKIDAQGQSSNGDSSDASADDGETKLAEELGGLPKLALDDADKPELALCTPLQAGMLSQTLASEGTLYVHAFPLRLRRAADAEQLRSAWDQALGAFDILRTSFHFAESSGRWAQVVHSAFALPWKTIQTEDAPADLAKQAVSSLSLGSEGGLSKPPWCLLEAHGQDATHLVVAMHHAMYDGVSFANLLGHVARIFAGDEAPKLPAFIPLARRIVREEKRATEHWTERMRGSSTRFLPERDASRSDSTAAWRASIDFSADEGEQLRRVARRYQVTPQSIGQLALAQLLARYSGLVDISFCQVVSGRTLPDAGEVVGPVFNTIPCRVQLDSHLKAREALRRIHADNVAGLKAQHASLRDIQKALQLPAISDVLFVFQPFVERDGSETERPWSAVPRSSDTDEGATQFSLNLELHEQRDGFAVFSSCAADVFSREQLDEALQLYRQAVVDIISQPNGTVVTPEAEAKAAKLKPAETNEQSSESGDEPAAELSGQQQEVRKLAAQILRVDVDKLLPSTKLASVGLDSISAIQLSSRCRKAGIKLAPTDIVRAPTIKELLRLVSGSPNGHAESKKPTSTGIVTLSGSQAEVATSHISEVLRRGSKVLVSSAGVEYAFACWQRSNGRAFQVCVLRRANERIDVKQLEQAWSSLLEKHEVLRGIPVPTNDASQPLALLIAKDGPTLQVQELEGADEDEAATQQARSLLCEHMPANAAQCRLLLLHGKKHDYVVLNMAHVLYDGWSLPLLLGDLEAMYQGKEASASADFEGFLSSSGADEGAQEKYWREALGEKFSPALWPTQAAKSEGPAVTLFDIEVRSELTADDVRSCARDIGVSSSSLVLGAWALVQAKRCDSAATFGIIQTGRGSEELANLAAPCLNVAPLHVRLQGSQDEQAELARVAGKLQSELLGRPREVEQSRISRIAEWTGRKGQPLVNVTINLLFATQGRNDDEAPEPKKDALWQRMPVKHRLSQEEQSAPVTAADVHLGEPPALMFPELQVDLDVVVATSAESGKLIFVAECARELVDEADARAALGEWAELLASAVRAKRS